ncbi:MAG: MoaD/ThiS family protein [Dehalococcoidia bacterium]|nr:MoaD/ThiS family protein [Dehalococcoidia bacterium]
MARVSIPATLRNLCGGSQELDVPAVTIDELLHAIDARCPGFYARVVENGRLRPELAFAIDGEIMPLGLHDAIAPGAEVTIVPALGGG